MNILREDFPHRLESGLTLREHFAALAMQALIAGPTGDQLTEDMVADQAVEYADAMLHRLRTKEAPQ